MRVLHVVPSISRSEGGPSRSVQGLVSGLCRAGVETWLMTLNQGELPWMSDVDRFVSGGSFEEALKRINPDIVHMHGIWSIGLHRCVNICRRRGIPYVIAPRGMLEPWSLRQKWLKKTIARFLYQNRDLRHAAALHATAESEVSQFRKLGFSNRSVTSPNGVNVPVAVPNRVPHAPGEKRRALFVSRMHPKKGVLELIESWARVQPFEWECELVYTVRSDEEKTYEGVVINRVRTLGLDDRIVFTGTLDDDEKWAAYARADLFVLPTYSENFGIVVAEALWSGVPVITTKGAPWSDLLAEKCGWWIDLPPKQSLDAAIRDATSLSVQELDTMGQNGRTLVEEKYVWDAVVEPLKYCYECILRKARHG